MLQGGGFFLMAVSRTLLQLFFSRMLLGFMGAVSTFAFIMVGRSGGDIRRGISAIQSGMTLGQVLGPAVGALVAARLGFRLSFVIAGFMLWGCSALVGWGVPTRQPQEHARDRAQTTSVREIATDGAESSDHVSHQRFVGAGFAGYTFSIELGQWQNSDAF